MSITKQSQKTWLAGASLSLLAIGIFATVIFGVSLIEFYRIAQTGGSIDKDSMLLLPIGLDIVQMGWALERDVDPNTIPEQFIRSPTMIADTAAFRLYSGLGVGIFFLIMGGLIGYPILRSNQEWED